MMENRSFDHMLGYLVLAGGRADVDGLRAGMSNRHGGRGYRVRHLKATKLGPDPDPCHSQTCVREQLQGGNGGFVANCARTHPGDRTPGLVMGYYKAADLPVYDYLAREFCICDRWFSSVPGPTWANRLYATAGRSGRSTTPRVPLYDLPSFLRHLDRRRVAWRWYYHDVPSLPASTPAIATSVASASTFGCSTAGAFLDAASSRLPPPETCPPFPGIDPNYIDVDFGASASNDDHPPSDVMGGQDLILRLVNASSAARPGRRPCS